MDESPKIIEEDVDEEKSDNSENSDPLDKQPIFEETAENSEEVKLQKLHYKLETDSKFIKSASNFIISLYTHFKSKYKLKSECIKLASIVQNHIIHHNKKFVRKNKYSWINDETSDEYFLHYSKIINKSRIFVEKVIKNLKQSERSTFQDINNYWMKTAKLERLDEGNTVLPFVYAPHKIEEILVVNIFHFFNYFFRKRFK